MEEKKFPIFIKGPYGPDSGGYLWCYADYSGKIKITNWHRFLYEQVHGIQSSDIDIHHKDENKLNNIQSNFEAINKGKHTSFHKKGKGEILTLICLLCGKSFERQACKERDRLKRNHAGPFCSHGHASSYLRKVIGV